MSLVLDFWGVFVDCVCWEWATVFVLNSWVSWVNFFWVVVPIQIKVVVVGGSNLGLLWLALWFGSSFVVWFVIYWWVWSL